MRLRNLVIVAALAPAIGLAQPVEGDYIEDRSNHVFGCYCEWSGESVTGGTDATLGWRFTRGAWQGVNLAGVKLALVIQAQATLSQGQPPRRSVLVLDRAATAQQRRAAERWLAHHFAPLLGDVIERRVLAIEFGREPERAWLSVPNLINMQVRKARPKEDSLPGSTLWYDPFIPLVESELGTTLHTAYKGDEFRRQWDKHEPGVRGYFGTFRISERPIT